MTAHFRKKSLFFRDTRDHPEYDTKVRLSISGPSFSEVLAEVESVKRKLTLVSFLASTLPLHFEGSIIPTPNRKAIVMTINTGEPT